MNLKQEKDVANDALPSNRTEITHDIFLQLLAKGAAIEASESDREIPISAALSAPQSLAPSPQKPTVNPVL